MVRLMKQLTEKVLLELIGHEAIVRTTYKDSKGIWTWSVGITSASGHSVERYIKNEQSMEKCLEVFIWAVERYAKEVIRAFPNRTLTESQFAAALSFHYNTGKISSASWVKSFNAGNVEKAREEFMNWKKPPEIEGRRRAERDLFFDGKWSNNGTVTEYKTYENGNVNWKSGKKVDIKAALKKAMSEDVEKAPEQETKSWFEGLLSLLTSIFSRKG